MLAKWIDQFNCGAATKAIDPGLCLGRVGVDGEESSGDGSPTFQRPGLRHPAGWGAKEESACTPSNEARDTGTESETIRNRIRAFPHRFHTSPRVSEGFNANAKETSTEPIIMSHHDQAPSAAPPILPPVPAPAFPEGLASGRLTDRAAVRLCHRFVPVGLARWHSHELRIGLRVAFHAA